MDAPAELRIRTLRIERFRAFRDISIEGLGRVNLLTGENNTGKSSVLEALRILASDASPFVIRQILNFREESGGDGDEGIPLTGNDALFAWSSLFHNFPDFTPSLNPVRISSNGSRSPMSVTMDAVWQIEEETEEGGRKRTFVSPDTLFGFDQNSQPVLRFTIGDHTRFMPLRDMDRFSLRGRFLRPDSDRDYGLSCVYVNPYGGERTSTLGPLWDEVALSDREADVVQALQIVDPKIDAVSMVGGEGRRRSRTAIVRSKAFPRPVPLRSYGDGLNRLFGIVLSLVNAKGGLLLIDEFENGLHFSVQYKIWQAIIRLARDLDVQVFATSHSWDAIKAFQVAASESPEDGALVRLLRKGDDIVPTVFTEGELAVVTESGIEVR